MPIPTIVHLDADAFFVSVEQALNPSLRGKKVAVGGRERGIISSASYEARACGVYTPMPTQRALKVCPDLVLVPHTAGVYGEYSRKLFDLCEQLTPYVERNSIDEGYLDVGPCGHKTAAAVEAVVRGLQQRIWDRLQITVSFGLASNKLIAAIASKLRKPRGFIVVPPGTEAAFLAPLEIGRLPGVGTKTEASLKERGIERVRDLFERPEAELRSVFGEGWRGMLAMARGEDDRVVETEHEDAKSYSQQETFGKDISDFAEIERVAKGMIDDLLPKIRADGKRVRTLTVKVRYPDFEQASAGHSLPEAVELETPFYPWIAPLLKQAWTKRRPLRLVSVKLSGVEAPQAQLEMFAEGDEKRKRLAATLDALKAARGSGAIVRGAQIKK
ncbi:DNA polymerase IV [Nibricoccus aquaticus]|uniref:DNA polymerase IV n=1 Tax=Nibricoccus aquaticus TaxID=2576891 RepID=A0A290QAF7_9BACT|nr:DNA polymerase IV [Nibricoccus aquaticus]ATC65504.1 DNA polymerase IV [Nibricoccus aquaticus]